MMHESDDFPKTVSKNLEQFRSHFYQREAHHLEFQALEDRKDPVFMFAFEGGSYSFPLLLGPEPIAYLTAVSIRRTPKGQVRCINMLYESMIATAYCCDLLA
jgi:hypothetical protein